MKKTIIIIAAVVLVIGLLVGAYFLGAFRFMGFAPENGNEAQYIGHEAAKTAALEEAGFAADGVLKLRSEFEKEHGDVYYEVSFLAKGMEYEYYIGAENGNVLSATSEKDD